MITITHSSTETPITDLIATRTAIQNGSTTALAQANLAIDVAQSAACAHVFASTDFDRLRTAASNPANASANTAQRPLAGLSVSIKDLFDIQGEPTVAGSRVLADAPWATADCVAVARLRAAGAGLIGRTHMVEFAFSGIGNNPHYGTPAAWDGRYGHRVGASDARHHVPGGSSSGAGVSVATGAAFIGLGSDTGGSIRIPAALNGIVGFKCTAARVPTTGALPLSTTMDTVCAITRSVRDGILAHEVLAARRVVRSPSPLAGYRLAVVNTLMQDDLEPVVARAFERTLARLRSCGAHIEVINLNELSELGAINAGGGFSPVESYAWHRHLLAQHADQYDPRVRARIERGAGMTAFEYLDLIAARRDWIARVESRLQHLDAVLSPTVPITAPHYADVAPGAERDVAFFKANGLLLRNTSAINVLDGCAISIPCHQAGELPMGLMLWHAANHDDTVLNVALQAETALRSTSGSTLAQPRA
jgi:aspartyl-tRNA(Asn)/glutamyl-tRNA(Gln) amidotransferase subunit A